MLWAEPVAHLVGLRSAIGENMNRASLFVAALSLFSLQALAKDNLVATAGAPSVLAPMPHELDKKSETEHYGLQSAAFDVASLGIAAAALSTNSEGLGYVSLGTYLVGSPIVHLAHGEPLRALGSLGLRAAVPTISGFVAVGISGEKGLGGLFPAAIGVGIGAAVAMVIDDVLLAQHEVRPEPTIAFSPGFDPFKKEATLNLSGTF